MSSYNRRKDVQEKDGYSWGCNIALQAKDNVYVREFINELYYNMDLTFWRVGLARAIKDKIEKQD